MKPEIIILISFILLWFAGWGIYLYRKNHKPTVIAKAIIEGNNFNQFIPNDNKVKDFTLNIVFSDKSDLDMSQYCDLVIKAKDLIDNNFTEITKRKNDMFSPNGNENENPDIENKAAIFENMENLSDNDFKNYIKIDTVTDGKSTLPTHKTNDLNNDISE
jgi:hypothetical protein